MTQISFKAKWACLCLDIYASVAYHLFIDHLHHHRHHHRHVRWFLLINSLSTKFRCYFSHSLALLFRSLVSQKRAVINLSFMAVSFIKNISSFCLLYGFAIRVYTYYILHIWWLDCKSKVTVSKRRRRKKIK